MTTPPYTYQPGKQVIYNVSPSPRKPVRRLSYLCLYRMKQNVDWAHDVAFDLGLYDEALRYAKIGYRIACALASGDYKIFEI